MRRFSQLALLALAALTLTGCMRGCTSPRPPIHLNPNMDYQPRVNSQQESGFFYDGVAMREPIAGTIARGELHLLCVGADRISAHRSLATIDRVHDRIRRLQFQMSRITRPGADDAARLRRMTDDARRELGALFDMLIRPAIDEIRDARQIIFLGLGASGHVAQDACQKFFRLGTPCSAITNTPGILQVAAISRPGDVLVMVSHLGAWPEIESAATTARENGAGVIAITDPRVELANIATVFFSCDRLEDTSVYTPMSSRLAQLALLDALYVAYALALGETATQNLRRSKNALLR